MGRRLTQNRMASVLDSVAPEGFHAVASEMGGVALYADREGVPCLVGRVFAMYDVGRRPERVDFVPEAREEPAVLEFFLRTPTSALYGVSTYMRSTPRPGA